MSAGPCTCGGPARGLGHGENCLAWSLNYVPPTPAPPVPSPLAVPDTIRQLVHHVADALGDEVVGVEWEYGGARFRMRRHQVSCFPRTALWSISAFEDNGDGMRRFWEPYLTVQQTEDLSALAIEVEQWASGLAARAVTDGNWGRPT